MRCRLRGGPPCLYLYSRPTKQIIIDSDSIHAIQF
jgi:hypothetical protein